MGPQRNPKSTADTQLTSKVPPIDSMPSISSLLHPRRLPYACKTGFAYLSPLHCQCSGGLAGFEAGKGRSNANKWRGFVGYSILSITMTVNSALLTHLRKEAPTTSCNGQRFHAQYADLGGRLRYVVGAVLGSEIKSATRKVPYPTTS
ncbi:hypothetical protein DL95DRAFT_397821 [Leptodontidium sp. 2 PMI_412]|nr:hypothetical protein DL95DRAFT_397821 [Leptodontidium sp. 2 PMI_412]